MTQLGEAIGIAFITEGPCPFCESKEDPEQVTLEIINDSEDLGDNTAGRPHKRIKNPDHSREDVDLEIKKSYLRDNNWSTIGLNAHHVIPGNASLAKATDLLRWIAWEVEVKKRWYSTKVPEKVGVISREPSERGVIVEKTRTVESRTKKGKFRILDQASTQGHSVYGVVPYDINGGANGIWLPSNDPVANWSDLSEAWKARYAKRAMRKLERQFHDAHKTYSKSVLLELQAIEAKVLEAANACKEHKDSDTEPWPAPRRLAAAIDQLSLEIKNRKLVGEPGKRFEKDWSTSRFAAGYKLPSKKKKKRR